MPNVRLIPFEIRSGPENMAADDLLLADAVNGKASLRFYGWREATLSLGYFQSFGERLAQPLLASLPVVRRSTGGGAIVHHHELTYSLGISKDPLEPIGGSAAKREPKPEWGCRMHHLIATVLAGFGVTADPVVCGEELKSDPFLCFHHHTAGDLAMGSRSQLRHKIIGSAQRKQHGAILQHGSILLAASEFAPSLPGIRERSQVIVSPTELAASITAACEQEFSWTFQESRWSESEQTAISTIVRERYGDRNWTEKR